MRSEEEIRKMLNNLWERYEAAHEAGAVLTSYELWLQIQILKWVLGEE